MRSNTLPDAHDAAPETPIVGRVVGVGPPDVAGRLPDSTMLQLCSLDWSVPNFSTLSRRQKALAVNIPRRGAKDPPHLLTGSTDIKVDGDGERHARKHCGPKRPVWRKIHLGIGAAHARIAPSPDLWPVLTG